MRVLALEPYYGGSHKAFLDGWREHSRHAWTLMGLPAYKWKWRMRHGAVTFGDRVREARGRGLSWDVLFCSDMLDLAALRGLLQPDAAALPAVVYFHENQLTYPVADESRRDYAYAFTNMTSGLAARRVWFNSAFHRSSFLSALAGLLDRMPDHQPFDAVQRIESRSEVQPPGIRPLPPRPPRRPGPPRLLWVARWEFDKAPEVFFEALDALAGQGADFRVRVLGERFRHSPPVFEQARRRLGPRIEAWGYLESRAAYERALLESDVVVSTAAHEFFGIGLAEAVAAGAYPLVPERLAYPEVLSRADNPDFFYRGDAAALAVRLAETARSVADGALWQGRPDRGRRTVARFLWPARAAALDDALAQAASAAAV